MEEVKGEISESHLEIEKRESKIKNFLFGWVKDGYDKAFLVLLAVSCAIGIWIFFYTKGQPLWYDAANFLSTAQKWALNLTNVNDIWYYRRGIFWVLYSFIFFKVGIGEVGIQFSGVLFYLGVIISSYFLLKEMFNKKIALISSIPLSLSWVLLFYIGRSMTELPSTFFLLLSLLFFWKGYVLKKGNKFLYLFGFFYALACFTRMELLLFAFPFFVYIFIDQKLKLFVDKRLWITLAIFLITLLPVIILYLTHYGNIITDILIYYFGIGAQQAGVSSSASSKTFFDLFSYFGDLPYLLTTALFIVFLIGVLFFFANLFIGIDKLFKDKDIQKKFFILLWILVPIFVLGRITDYVEERYLIPLFPFLFMLVAIPFLKFEDLLVKHFKFKKTLALGLSVLILLVMILPGISFGKSLIDDKKASYLEVEQSALWFKANSNPQDVMISDSLPYFTYYAQRTTYPFNIRNWARHLEVTSLFNYSEGEQGFNEFVNNTHPAYMMLSSFEASAQWVYDYPQNHSNILTPIKAFYQSGTQQPVIIIYKFDYNNSTKI